MAASQSTNTTPQGFSVYQPMLGAPLQFFPALGTKELDDMLDAYIPGPALLKEKRATVSVDFLDYTQTTGQAFKFYAVPGLTATIAGSPSTVSPLQATASVSSRNTSPVASNWDWSSVTGRTPSRVSTHAHSSRKGSTANSSSRRHSPTDFSHLPGMKILTKNGMDVTNSASRGSKTKEQRDHAHLMRIIKACDACRKKKIRCDPSHKKRGASSQAHVQPGTKPSKKPRTLSHDKPSVAPPAPVAAESFPPPHTPSLDLDSSLEFPEFESFDMSTATHEPWEDFIHYPPAEFQPDYDFFFDPQGFLLPQDQQTSTPSSVSPFMSSSDDQFFSQTMSSTSSSDSPDLMDCGLLQTISSSSTSPEIPDIESYAMPPDLSLSTTPDTIGRDRHVLPQYPTPPPSSSSGPEGLESRVVRAPWSESSDPRVIEDHVQAQSGGSVDLADVDVNSQSTSPVSLGLDRYVDYQSLTAVNDPTSSDRRAEDNVFTSRATSLEPVLSENSVQPQLASSDPQGEDSRVVVVPCSESHALLTTGESVQSTPDGLECCAQPQSNSPAEPGVAESQALLYSSREPAPASVADEHVSQPEARLTDKFCEGHSVLAQATVSPSTLRVVDAMIRRPISGFRSAPLSSSLKETTRQDNDSAKSRAPGLEAESFEAYGVGSSAPVDFARLMTPRTQIPGLRMPTVPEVSGMGVLEILPRGVPMDREPLTGTDCLSLGHPGSSTSLTMAGVSMCAALQLFAKLKKEPKKESKAASGNSWMVGLMVLILLAAFASSLSPYC